MPNLKKINTRLKELGHADMQAYSVRYQGYFIDSKPSRNKPANTCVFLGDDIYVALDNLERWHNGEDV